MANWKKVLDNTDNSRVYNIALKRVRETNGDISCSYCRYHKGENDRRKDFKCWKTVTKRKTQYKPL